MRLEMVIDGAEPIAGVLTVEGGDPTRFCGWLELMAVITEALRSAVPVTGA